MICFYDISNNKNRRTVENLLKNSGFIRIQKSVFCYESKLKINKNLFRELRRNIDNKTDSLMIVKSIAKTLKNELVYGKKGDWNNNNTCFL